MDARSVAIVAVVVAVAIGIELVRRALRRAKIRGRAVRAAEGEREAAELLEGEGYAVVGAQVGSEYALVVDGVAQSVYVRADYIVERDGARFVAEVKTGRSAPRIENAATRRQLLEYEMAFGVDGVLLVDADAKRVRRVEFPNKPRERAHMSLLWPALAFVAVAIVIARFAQVF